MGVLGAIGLTYLLNQTRVIVLYFVVAYRNDWFGLLHDYLVPTLIIALCSLFFAWWATWSIRSDSLARTLTSAGPAA
jgi:exosortase family protein XrtM